MTLRKAQKDAPNLIDILDSLYGHLEETRDVWFREVLTTFGSALDRGAGVGLVLYDVSGDTLRFDKIAGFNLSPGHIEAATQMHGQPQTAQALRAVYRTATCRTLDDARKSSPEIADRVLDAYAPLGVEDHLIVNGADPSGLGCAMYIYSKKRLEMRKGELLLLGRMASHLAATYRLHRRLTQVLPEQRASVDAVLKPNGHIEHAEHAAQSSESRRCLSSAVEKREWARGRDRRSDVVGAMATWNPLVLARWSLVDRYERDGRRYVVARENAPSPRGPEALSARERQVAALACIGHSNKSIAYELGLSHSTVRVLTARAAAKLGVRTRDELIERMRGH